MHHCHQVPQQSKQEPGPSKGGREQEELVAPLHVQKGRPEVTEVQGPTPAHVLNSYIAPAIFGQDPAPPPQSTDSCSSSSTCIRSSCLPCGAQQGLGDVCLRLGVAHFLRGGAFRGGRGGRGHDWWHRTDIRREGEVGKVGVQHVSRRRKEKTLPDHMNERNDRVEHFGGEGNENEEED